MICQKSRILKGSTEMYEGCKYQNFFFSQPILTISKKLKYIKYHFTIFSRVGPPEKTIDLTKNV